MRFNDWLPSPPWRKPRIFTVRQFLHCVFVASSDPFINHGVCVHGQRACISLPRFGSRMISPPLGYSTEGPPDLVRLDALLPEPTVIERLGAFLEIVRRDECVDHFCRTIWKNQRAKRMTRIFIYSSFNSCHRSTTFQLPLRAENSFSMIREHSSGSKLGAQQNTSM